MSEQINSNVAFQLKSARVHKGWSLDETSKHCGVSKAMLGQIERGESSPTIAKLWNIATGFALPLSYFLERKNVENEKIKQVTQEPGMSIETIFEYDKNTGLEMFELYFSVGHEQHSQAHQVGVIEHIVVTSGQMAYFADQQWRTLYCGDKSKFNADQPHIYRNIGDTPLCFFNIILYP
jgi:transcriptional regulator with XRE-family HTH domain